MAHAAFLQVIQEYSTYQENVAYYIGPTTGINICVCLIAAMKSFGGDLLKLELKYWGAAALIFVINMEAPFCWVSCDFDSGIVS